MEANTNNSPVPVITPQSAPQQPTFVPAIAPTPVKSNKKVFAIIGSLVALIIIVFIAIFAVLLPRLNNSSSGEGEIVWWGFWEESQVTPLIAEYQSQHPGVTIKYVKQSQTDYRERLSSSIARKQAPDIFKIHNTWVPMFSEDLATLPGDIMPEEEYINTFYSPVKDSLITKEGIVGIPLSFDALGLFVNQDIFTTFSESVPKSWNELRQTATNLTIKNLERTSDNNIEQSGIALGLVDNVEYWQEILMLMLIQNGANLVDLNGSLASGAYQYYLQFKTVDRVWDETFPDSVTAFAAGKVAMILAPSTASQKVLDLNPNVRFKVYPVPQLPKLNDSDPNVTYATFWAESVWSGSKHQKESWEFLKFMSSSSSIVKLGLNEPSPRKDMKANYASNPYYASTVNEADTARVWYVASDTNDGQTGINSSLAEAYKKPLAVTGNLSVAGDIEKLLPQVSLEVRTILSKYGLVAPPPPPEE